MQSLCFPTISPAVNILLLLAYSCQWKAKFDEELKVLTVCLRDRIRLTFTERCKVP